MATRPRAEGTVAKVMPLDSVATIETPPLRQAAGALGEMHSQVQSQIILRY